MKNAAQPGRTGSLVWRSTDGGATWTAAGQPDLGDAAAIQVDPVNAGVVYASGTRGLAKSTDEGTTWRVVYRSESAGGAGSVTIHPEDPAHVWVVTSDGVMESRNGGSNWTARPDVAAPSPAPELPSRLLVDPTGSGAVAALGASSLRLSRDGGSRWTTLALPDGPGYRGFQNFAFDAVTPGTLYAGTTRPGASMILVSTDWGATWTERPPVFNWQPALNGLMSDPARGGVLYVTYYGSVWNPDGIYRSTDGGLNWTAGAVSVDASKRAAALQPSCNAGGLLVISAGSRLMTSADYGTTWTASRLSDVTDVSAGAGCQAYALTARTADAYVAKLRSDGATEWLTYLGGSRSETVSGIAVDTSGDVYVAGNTQSTDFPATARIGRGNDPVTYSPTHAFLTKFDANGAVQYSALISSDLSESVTAVAADASGNAYLLGETSSAYFPVTAGALRTERSNAGYPAGGFLMKLGSTGTLLYSTYLAAEGVGSKPMSVAATAGGEAYVSGTGATPTAAGAAIPAASSGFLVRLNTSGSALTYTRAIEQDAAGKLGTDTGARAFLVSTREPDEVYLAGVTSSVPSSGRGFVSPLTGLDCASSTPGLVLRGDTYVSKLKGKDLTEQFTAVLGGGCRTTPAALAVSTTGTIGLSVVTGRSFPLAGAAVGAPTCDARSGALVRISADGSRLSGSTYLDNCGGTPVAMSGATAWTALTRQGHARLAAFADAPALRLDRAADGFSGYGLWAVPGSFLTLYGYGFSSGSYDLGLAPPEPLPETLDGTTIWFDDVRAPIVQLDSGKAMVTVPFDLKGWTRIRVTRGETASNDLWMPVRDAAPSVWTVDFPRTADYGELLTGGFPDAIAINEDGVQNDAAHPARPGSTITVFTTGPGPTSPATRAGVTAEDGASFVDVPVCWEDTWQNARARTIPQFLTSLLRVDAQVPSGATGGGLQRLPFSFGMFSIDRTQRSRCPNVMSGAWVARPGPVAGIYVK